MPFSQPALSVALVSRNEGHLLDACLGAVAPWAASILVLDMESTDDTRAVAARWGARVEHVAFAPVVEQVRQRQISSTDGDWLVLLDPDEILPEGFPADVAALIEQHPDAAAFRWPFLDTFFGVPLAQSRALARKIVVVHRARVEYRVDQRAHEEPQVLGPVVDADHTRHDPVLHHTFVSVPAIADKMARYGSTGNPLLLDSLSEPQLPLALLLFRHVVRGRAWKDGSAGVHAASISALHDYLAWLRAWELRGARPVELSRSTRAALAGLDGASRAAVRAKKSVRGLRQYHRGP